MIFRPQEARWILTGKKTQTRRPASRPDEFGIRHCPITTGRTYPIDRDHAGQTAGYLFVTTIELQPIGDLSFLDARAEGYRTSREFFDTWLETHGTIDPDRMVWAVTFKVAEEVRLLAPAEQDPTRLRCDEEGYTTKASLAGDDLEAVDARTLARFADVARANNSARGSTQLQAERDSLQVRLGNLRVLASQRAVNVDADLRIIQRRLDAIERKIQRAA